MLIDNIVKRFKDLKKNGKRRIWKEQLVMKLAKAIYPLFLTIVNTILKKVFFI